MKFTKKQKSNSEQTYDKFLDVPYFSQRLDISLSQWKSKSCGIVSLSMAIKFRGSLDLLIKEGLKEKAYLEGIGWIHDGLVRIAKKYGFKKSFRKEWKNFDKKNSKEKDQVLRYVVVLLKKDIPVLASIKKRKGGHLVLIAGFRILKDKKILRGFFVHDPDDRLRTKGKYKYVTTEKFLKLWRGRIVVIKS
jgi:hypothetical protein